MRIVDDNTPRLRTTHSPFSYRVLGWNERGEHVLSRNKFEAVLHHNRIYAGPANQSWGATWWGPSLEALDIAWSLHRSGYPALLVDDL